MYLNVSTQRQFCNEATLSLVFEMEKMTAQGAFYNVFTSPHSKIKGCIVVWCSNRYSSEAWNDEAKKNIYLQFENRAAIAPGQLSTDIILKLTEG